MPVETVLMVSFMVDVKWHGICFAELVCSCVLLSGDARFPIARTDASGIMHPYFTI